MIRLVAAFLMVSGLVVAAPIPKSLKSQKPVSLVGSVWSCTTSIDKGNPEYRFLDDGLLEYKHSAVATNSTQGTWILDGLELTIEINKWSTHTGRLEGDSITLQSRNKNNLSWVTVLTRKPDGK
jgi:hypothetical protein